ncbi:hypothetical protein, partial [Pseudomonas carnis]|uniref:hypothetical protein n=1 Tax=Pseudomonas carnis TaxID=2487355 RepID=UPI001E491786
LLVSGSYFFVGLVVMNVAETQGSLANGFHRSLLDSISPKKANRFCIMLEALSTVIRLKSMQN